MIFNSKISFAIVMIAILVSVSNVSAQGQDGWNKEFSSMNYDTLYVSNSGGAVNVNLNGLTKVSFTPAGATEPKNMLVIAADNNSMVLADLKLTGGNLDIAGDIRVGKNTWGGSTFTTPSSSGGTDTPTGGEVSNYSAPLSGFRSLYCNQGEYLVGVKVDTNNKVIGFYCQKL